MFLEGLDELDQKIVQLLIKNARISYSEIGSLVGISRVAVKMRVQSLEKRGVIEEYTTIINPQKISGAVSCYFEIETSPDTLAQVTAGGDGAPVPQRDGDADLPGDRQGQAACPRGRRVGRGDGAADRGSDRPASRSTQQQLQYDSVPDQGYQGAAAVTLRFTPSVNNGGRLKKDCKNY